MDGLELQRIRRGSIVWNRAVPMVVTEIDLQQGLVIVGPWDIERMHLDDARGYQFIRMSPDDVKKHLSLRPDFTDHDPHPELKAADYRPIPSCMSCIKSTPVPGRAFRYYCARYQTEVYHNYTCNHHE